MGPKWNVTQADKEILALWPGFGTLEISKQGSLNQGVIG